MIRLGYLDEDKGNRNQFYWAFKNDFKVIMLEDNTKLQSVDDVLDQIDEQEIEVLAVDFRLADGGWVPYNGDEVVRAIWEKRRYFPVFMLTSYVNNALKKMDNVFLVNDKDGLSDKVMVEMLKNQISSSVETYRRMVQERESRFRFLLSKRGNDALSDSEEKELMRLNFELNAIDVKSNPLSSEYIQTKGITELHEMVDMTRALLESLKK